MGGDGSDAEPVEYIKEISNAPPKKRTPRVEGDKPAAVTEGEGGDERDQAKFEPTYDNEEDGDRDGNPDGNREIRKWAPRAENG
jgi:hypothetical protein